MVSEALTNFLYHKSLLETIPEGEEKLEIVVSTVETIDDLTNLLLTEKLHHNTSSAIVHSVIGYLKQDQEKRIHRLYKKRPYYICSVAFMCKPLCIPKAVGCLHIEQFFTNFYVLPEYRRKGLARKLFEETKKVYGIGLDIINLGSSLEAYALQKALDIPSDPLEMAKRSIDARKKHGTLHP